MLLQHDALKTFKDLYMTYETDRPNIHHAGYDFLVHTHLVRWRLNSFTKQHLSKVLRRPLFFVIFAKVKSMAKLPVENIYEELENTHLDITQTKSREKEMLLTHHIHKAGLTPQSPSDWQTVRSLSVSKQRQVQCYFFGIRLNTEKTWEAICVPGSLTQKWQPITDLRWILLWIYKGWMTSESPMPYLVLTRRWTATGNWY